MTGILPIKKDGSQSAVSDFAEYSILEPGEFAEYTGFTEGEVRGLCERHGISFAEAREWYDGYEFSSVGAVYNPYSVMLAVRRGKFGSYWRKTSAAESMMTYINMDFEGLQETIARLIAGEEIEVRTDRFENDFETFQSKDDVLTLMIHLGYLAWNEEEGTARIPNKEVRTEFEKILEGTGASKRWVELKRDRSSEGAIGQIKSKDYPAVLRDYGGEIVMAGINYDLKTKEHNCLIEKTS